MGSKRNAHWVLMWEIEVNSLFGRLKPRRQCDILAVFQKNLMGVCELVAPGWVYWPQQCYVNTERKFDFQKMQMNSWGAEKLSAFQGFCISEEPNGSLWTGCTWLSVLTKAVLCEHKIEIWFSKNARNSWAAKKLSASQGFCSINWII